MLENRHTAKAQAQINRLSCIRPGLPVTYSRQLILGASRLSLPLGSVSLSSEPARTACTGLGQSQVRLWDLPPPTPLTLHTTVYYVLADFSTEDSMPASLIAHQTFPTSS